MMLEEGSKMVWRITNVPTSESLVAIKCKHTDEGDYQIYTSEGAIICVIRGTTPDSICEGLATVVPRDIGFDQGRSYIRKALGL